MVVTTGFQPKDYAYESSANGAIICSKMQPRVVKGCKPQMSFFFEETVETVVE